MSRQIDFPDIEDIQDAGYDMPTAVEFWAHMHSSHDRDPRTWWRFLSIVRANGGLIGCRNPVGRVLH